MRLLLGLGIVASLSACTLLQAPANHSAGSSPSASAKPSTPSPPSLPDAMGDQAVVAQIVQATSGFDSPLASSPRCTIGPQQTRLWRFASGRYLVDAPCGHGAPVDHLLWVAASDVTTTDAAYAPLVRVHESAGLQVNMAYAGSRIFCKDTGPTLGQRGDGDCKIREPLYGQARCYTRPEVAAGLAKAAAALVQRDPALRLQVLDCYRPVYVQQRMFAIVADPKWVAEPKPPRYGGHNRAVAIDLTVLRNGVPLDMGTSFDAFDERSSFTPDGQGITAAQQANRVLLRQLMIEHGFRPYDGEWWHFSMPLDVAPINKPL